MLLVATEDRWHHHAAELLARAGFGIVRVYDSASAVSIHRALRPAAVVSSGALAGADGAALDRDLNEREPRLTLIQVPERFDAEAVGRVREQAARRPLS